MEWPPQQSIVVPAAGTGQAALVAHDAQSHRAEKASLRARIRTFRL
jgi:hypothetical protein